MKLDPKVIDLITSQGIELEVSRCYSGIQDNDLARITSLFYHALLIYDYGAFKRSKKTIWLNDNENDLDALALHELGHFFVLHQFPDDGNLNKDQQTESWAHELMADGCMVALCHILGIKLKKHTLEAVKSRVKDLKIREQNGFRP